MRTTEMEVKEDGQIVSLLIFYIKDGIWEVLGKFSWVSKRDKNEWIDSIAFDVSWLYLKNMSGWFLFEIKKQLLLETH